MGRTEVLRILRDHQDDLKKFRVNSIALFGSLAREEVRPQSDVDILVEFATPPTFKQYMNLKFFLEDLLNARVDLVSTRALKPQIRPYVEREAIYVT